MLLNAYAPTEPKHDVTFDAFQTIFLQARDEFQECIASATTYPI